MILLDTHVWLWWVSAPENLSENAVAAIEEAKDRNAIYFSSISCWEIAMLSKTGRLSLDRPVSKWIEITVVQNFATFLPVNNAIAVASVELPEPLHKDPADRILIATALTHGFKLVTKDHKIRQYPSIECVW